MKNLESEESENESEPVSLTSRISSWCHAHEKLVCVLAIVFALIAPSALPLYWYFTSDDVTPDDRSAGILIEEDFTLILRPDAAGYSSAWTASPAVTNYLNVDETTAGGDGDTTYNYADTNSEVDAYGVTDITNARGDDTIIDGVTVWAWAKRMSTGSCAFQVGVRIGTTNYFTMVAAAPTSSYVNYTHTYVTSPATDQPWTCAELNGTSIIITAPDATPNVAVTQCAMLVPGTQLLWAPTFTSTPDTSVVATTPYSYTATTNESSTFEGGLSTTLTSGSFILRPTGTAFTEGVLFASPAVSPWLNVDETTTGGDAATSYIYFNSGTETYWYASLSDCPSVTWGSHITDVSYWLIASGSSSSFSSDLADSEGGYDMGTTWYPPSGWTNYTRTGLSPRDGLWTWEKVNDTSFSYTRLTWVPFVTQMAMTITYGIPTPWFTFTPENATLWGTPGIEDVGNWNVYIRAESTPGDWSAWQNFTIEVGEPWDPTFTSTPEETSIAEYPYSYTPTVNETSTFTFDYEAPAQDPVTVSVTIRPNGDNSVTHFVYYPTPPVWTKEYVDADTRADSANPTTNYGTSTELYVYGLDRPSYVCYHFTYSEPSTWQTAWLNFYKSYDSAGIGNVIVYAGNPWTPYAETTLTWNSAPTGGYIDTSYNTTGHIMEFVDSQYADVWRNITSSALTSYIDSCDGDVYLILSANYSGGNAKGYESREGAVHIPHIAFQNTAANYYFDKLDETTTGGDGDTTYVSSSASLQSSLYLDYPTLTWTDYGTITDIDVGAWSIVRAQLGATDHSQEGLYISSTTYPYHNAADISYTYKNVSGQWELNPYTGAEWTTSQLDSIVSYVADPDTATSMYWTQTAIRINITYTPAAPAPWFTWTEANSTLWGTPPCSCLGVCWDIIIAATSTNGSGAAYQNFSLTTLGPWVPTFTSSPSLTTAGESFYSYVATCNETVTWPATIATNATFLDWGQANHTVWGTSASEDIGYYYVNVTATSVAGMLEGYQNYTLTVYIPTPVITTTPDTTATCTELYWYDCDADIPVTWSWASNGTSSLSFNTATGNVSGTPSFPISLGYFYVNITATSVSFGTTDYQNYTLVVTYIDEVEPVANAGPDQSVATNRTVHFDGSASHDTFGIVNWTWSFTHNGSLTYMYGETPSYIFNIPGDYIVTLNVSDAAGYWDIDTMTLVVTEIPLTPMDWITSPGVMTILGVVGFIGFIVFPVAYVKFRDKGKGAMNGFIAFIIIEMVLFGLFFASLLSG